MTPVVVLASASGTRRRLLEATGLSFVIDPAAVDESAIKAEAAGRPPVEVAARLAEAKARVVGARHPGAHVIGADQLLVCDGRMFDKPRDSGEAARHLRYLRGREHTLVGAVAVVFDGRLTWSHQAEARLVMRVFSEAFLENYMARAGPELLESVGAYRLEEAGVQLFASVSGDYFTILGLPLLPLLDHLRSAGAIQA